MADTGDAIIIGAGVQGASLAFHLARRGIRPIVIERKSIAAGATGRSSGFVRLHYDLEVEARLAWVSFGWYRDWAERVGGTCGFTQTGFLMLVPAGRFDHMRENVASQRQIGIPIEIADAAAIRGLAPMLAIEDDTIAAYEPGSGYADPASAAAGFLRAARDVGARYVGAAEVTGIRVAGGRVTGVDTTRGAFSAPVVVNAAGAWAAGIARLVGLEIPISIWRHDIGFLAPPPSVRLPFPMVIDYATSVYFRPEGTELVLVGLEDEGNFGGSPDRQTAHTAADFPERAARRICERVPAMADARYVTGHSGQDGITPDQRPILGPAGPDGFYLDCGHSGTGFKTAPAVGLSMSQVILDGAPQAVDISPFSLDRFAQRRLLVGERSYEAVWR